MNHQGTQIIETKRLLLRPFLIADSKAAFQNWMSDQAVTKYLRWKAHSEILETEDIIKDWIMRYEKPDFYQWAIVLQEINEPIGSISVVSKNDELDLVHIGYCIGEKWWHQGIVSEAFSAIIPFLFEKVGANRIESQHDPNNPHSGKVMEKCGLKYEGTLRQADFSNQGIVDAAIYSILHEEYKDR
ncbi:MAG: GNAT family N-acetyltransferase [Clostridiaceae bacterium]|jgi:ribosomal-protein-alanine N-acetyltransferase|nr:GNAT family N-acetyltransferase [Clostridiaceae bacterium]